MPPRFLGLFGKDNRCAQLRYPLMTMTSRRTKPAASALPLERPSDALVTLGLRRLIAQKHSDTSKGVSPEWALFFELRSGTGHGPRTAYVDALALNLWPSKQHWRVAYELKASRADFLRELAKPEKRSWAMEIAHEFWYVCYPGVAKPEEIPQGCGLMVADESLSKLKKTVQAPQRQVRELTMTEVAAFARKSQEERSLLFSYAGRELSEEDLQALLRSKQDQHFRDAVQAEAQRQLNERVGAAHATLQAYAQDLQRVGIEPPSWMAQPDLTQHVPWEARAWSQETFIKKPGLDLLLANERHLRSLRAQLERGLSQLSEAEQNTRSLVQKQTPATGE